MPQWQIRGEATKLMKAVMATAALIASLFTGIAHADPDSNEGNQEALAQRYLEQLRAIGVYPNNVRVAVNQAQTICAHLAAGESPDQVATSVVVGDGPTRKIVHAASTIYCPGKG